MYNLGDRRLNAGSYFTADFTLTQLNIISAFDIRRSVFDIRRSVFDVQQFAYMTALLIFSSVILFGHFFHTFAAVFIYHE